MTEDFFKNNILGRAQALCSESANKAMDGMTKQMNFDADADAWDRMYLNEDTEIEQTSTPAYTESASASRVNSKMPKAIIESMTKNPIDVKALNPNPMERMDLSDLENKRASKRVNESFSQIAPVQQVSNNGIDYSIIKAIINECLTEKLKELKSSMLEEGATIKTIGLKEGKIKLVDNKGNVFSAKLEKVGNVNN